MYKITDQWQRQWKEWLMQENWFLEINGFIANKRVDFGANKLTHQIKLIANQSYS